MAQTNSSAQSLLAWSAGVARAGWLAALLGLVLPAATAVAQTRTLQQSYPVDAFAIEYPLPHPAHPPAAELLALVVEMRITRGGLMQPHPSTENARFPLGQVPPGTRIWASGLRYVNQQILAEFERRGIGGVIITLPDLEEGSGRDLRGVGERSLRIRIWTGRVENIATVADGDRFGGSPEDRTNRPEHRFVRDGSPVRAGGADGLIRIDEIEDYAKRLSRHPGRRVDAKLRPGSYPGTTQIDYHVSEHKPWLAYFQVANNGTEATTEARERFGLSHSQLTGNDDILRVDYVTGDFDEVHAVFGSYEFPTYGFDRLRWRAFGAYSEYDASEIGVEDSLFSNDFSGGEWEAGGRLTLNLLQLGGFFLDGYGGVRWRNDSVDNAFFDDADKNFFLPEVGLAAHYDSLATRFDLEAGVEWNVPEVAGTDNRTLFELGRLGATEHFEILRWNGSLAFFLEPLLLYRRGWGDPGAPSRTTLAHEVVLSTRGQWSFGDRLVPQFQQVAGGLYTVRGYDQAVVADDGALIGSIEYRLHLARLLDPGGTPVEVPVLGPVHLRPSHVFTRADWDLVLKAFLDGGLTYPVRWDSRRTGIPDPDFSEDRESLASWGVGVELQFLRNLRAGIDVAWPRSQLSDGTEGSDDPEFHAVLTLMF